MNKTTKTVSIGSTLQSCPCHACAFFTSKEEEYRVMRDAAVYGGGL
jgi:hypothetical protein